ncbi:MAG: hypothetical protein M1816_003140 [Peltula sp. TS41687]|nr:MAG: hypothetical protein M1816_003140 [Peltula sp. TS41687]
MATTATPITIINGFLGAGKTTVILNLLSQLPTSYRVALLKNEVGDLAIDSALASQSSIAGVHELLNGCICCNLVGQLGDALAALRDTVQPDRIIIETSGSAFPATLAMEINRLSRETGHYLLDGVIVVIDVENWQGYEETSYTARAQARFTDLVVFNKWEDAGEERFEMCLDRLGDLEVDTPWVRSRGGVVGKEVLLGVDGALARRLGAGEGGEGGRQLHEHGHDEGEQEHKQHLDDHQSEVDVMSITLASSRDGSAVNRGVVDREKLEAFLGTVPAGEIYRMKAVLWSESPSSAADGQSVNGGQNHSEAHLNCYILNWAFGRWTLTEMRPPAGTGTHPTRRPDEPALRMTMVLPRWEAAKWKKKLEAAEWLCLSENNVDRVLEIRKMG